MKVCFRFVTTCYFARSAVLRGSTRESPLPARDNSNEECSLNIDQIMRAGPVMPVIVVESPAQGVALARALVAGGVRVLEVTLRTDAALDTIRAIREELPEAIVGAGTVLNAHDVDRVMKAGAAFAVSPGCMNGLLSHARRCGLAFLPGVCTPSDVMHVLDAGQDRMKFFPAEQAGGIAMLKALAGPFRQARYCPTGGIGAHNAADYLALPNVLCVGGSWIAPDAAIREGAWERVTELARAATALRPATA